MNPRTALRRRTKSGAGGEQSKYETIKVITGTVRHNYKGETLPLFRQYCVYDTSTLRLSAFLERRVDVNETKKRTCFASTIEGQYRRSGGLRERSPFLWPQIGATR